MDKETVLYGASDDLFEISGDYSEEMNPPDAPFHVAVSDGSLLEVKYDDLGEWKIQAVVRGKGLERIIPSVGEDKKHEGDYEKYTSYSDLAVFRGEIRFVAIVEDFKRFKV